MQLYLARKASQEGSSHGTYQVADSLSCLRWDIKSQSPSCRLDNREVSSELPLASVGVRKGTLKNFCAKKCGQTEEDKPGGWGGVVLGKWREIAMGGDGGRIVLTLECLAHSRTPPPSSWCGFVTCDLQTTLEQQRRHACKQGGWG
uniref:Uncharacterized protein n=1 Tax=Sphaerodactylus townsendi TaxID=933632 RepID=A0ACB8G5U4_9SAUR